MSSQAFICRPAVSCREISPTRLGSCRRLGDIACPLECLTDTTFDDMSPTLCTTEVHDCFVRGDFDHETMALSPAGSYHGLWWMEALDMMAANDKLEFWAATPAKCRYNKDKSMSDWVYLDF